MKQAALLGFYKDKGKTKPITAPGKSRAHAARPTKLRELSKKLSGSELRKQKRMALDARADVLDWGIVNEINRYKPLGKMSELGEAMGGQPSRGVANYTPFGTYAFAKDRAPTKETLEAWERRHKEADDLRTHAVMFIAPTDATPKGTIGNYRVVEHLKNLDKQGLLDPNERKILDVLEKFWVANPDIDRYKGLGSSYGVWGNNLTIRRHDSQKGGP